MATIRTKRIFRLALILPVVLFGVLSFLSIQRARPGPWHDTCVLLWQKQQWHELRALGQNLQRLGKPDTEALYFGMLASNELHEEEAIKTFAAFLLQRRILSLKVESAIARYWQIGSLRESIQVHRSQLTLAFFAILILLNLLPQRFSILTWTAALSIAGCVVLLL